MHQKVRHYISFLPFSKEDTQVILIYATDICFIHPSRPNWWKKDLDSDFSVMSSAYYKHGS